MKVVINKCYGGFSVSNKVYEYLGIPWDDHGYLYDLKRQILPEGDFEEQEKAIRTYPKLIEAVEKLGKRADGRYAELKIVEIPDGIDWYIDSYDGIEIIEEAHNSWG